VTTTPCQKATRSRITLSVDSVGRTSATYLVTVALEGELAAEGRLVAVLVDDDGRARPWSDEAVALVRS